MDNTTTANRIKSRRQKLKLTQSQLAQNIGRSLITIVRWEKGERTPNTSIMPQLAEALNTSVAYLMGLDEDEDKIAQAKQIAQQAEQTHWRDTVVGWTNDFFTVKRGDTEVRVPITEQTQPMLNDFMNRMLTSIIDNNTDSTNTKHEGASHIDISQSNVGRDANVNVGATTLTTQS